MGERIPAWHEGNGRHALMLEFWGDHQRHTIIVPGDSARFVWDDVSRVLTVDFDYGSEAAATAMFWDLLTIVPALRGDRR